MGGCSGDIHKLLNSHMSAFVLLLKDQKPVDCPDLTLKVPSHSRCPICSVLSWNIFCEIESHSKYFWMVQLGYWTVMIFLGEENFIQRYH